MRVGRWILITLSLFFSLGEAAAKEVILREGYNLRQQGSSRARKVGSLQAETRARILSQNRHWARVEINGRRSYVSVKAIVGTSRQSLPSDAPLPSFRPVEETTNPVTVTEEASAPAVATPTPVQENSPKASSFWKQVPEKNWAVIDADALKLRASPGTDAASSGSIRKGARVAVIESQEHDGRRWHRILPFDCGERHLPAGANACGKATWVAGDYVIKTPAPTTAEIDAADSVLAAPSTGTTEAGLCLDGSCAESASRDSLQGLQDLSSFIQNERVRPAETVQAADSEKSLYEDYLNFHHHFVKKYPLSRNRNKWARTNKSRFLASLIKTFGVEKAGKMVMALTAYGEARGERANSHWGQVAEMAFVAQIIKNRAEGGFRDDRFGEALRVKHLLNDARHESHLWGAKGATFRVALAESQFSTWNSNDANLDDVMVASGNRHLQRAFTAVESLENGQVVPDGALASAAVDHYHASWMTPWWAKSSRRVNAHVQTPGGRFKILAHKAYR